MRGYESWGRFIASHPARVVVPEWTSEIPPLRSIEGPVLAYGMGRSYGDVCLNNGATLLDTVRLSRFRQFDRQSGLITCDAGTTLDEIVDLVLPLGFFLPVSPGTKFVTVGGCIANDVHGKNHHRAGTWGRWVRSLELLRSDGSRLHCTPAENAELFRATIGGLGLTGLILSAEIELRRVASPFIFVERVPFRSLAEFSALSSISDESHEYTVAWFDSLAGRDARGIFFRGNHAPESGRPGRRPAASRRLPVAPFSPLLNQHSIRLFNMLYFHANERPAPRLMHYDPFLYPLDAVANWNAIYGRHGFLQYQFLVPEESGLEPVAEILDRAARSRQASFLTVLKKFGRLPSPGMLSFPRAGTTVCLDFAAKSDGLLPMLDGFDGIVAAAGGSVYPAKDARLSAERFRQFFPQWKEFATYADPHFSSSFWRRVMR